MFAFSLLVEELHKVDVIFANGLIIDYREPGQAKSRKKGVMRMVGSTCLFP